MFKVLIYKKKLTTVSWDEKSQDWIEDEIKKGDKITKYFDQAVEIQEGVTVEDFVKHLGKYEKDIDFCFAGYMNDLPLKLFLDELKKEVEFPNEIKEVEMYWFGEIMSEEINIVGALRSWILEDAAKAKGISSEAPYSLEFTPMSVWKKGKLILNENIIITDFGEMESRTEQVVFDGFKRWTFFDLISNFLYEITANGSPEEVYKLMIDLANKKYDIHEISKDKDQAAFWLGFLEAQLTELQTEITNALEEEKYEIVDSLKKDAESIKQEIGDLRREISKINNATKGNEQGPTKENE